MKTWHVQIRREAIASVVVEADSQDEAESKALAQMTDRSFGYDNLYIEDASEVVVENFMEE